MIVGVIALNLYKKAKTSKIGLSFFKVPLVILAIGSFFVAGEELSWGEHLIGWDTPQFIASHNDQNETNFHNLPYWDEVIDQKPRAIISILIFLGGFIAPLLYRSSALKFVTKYPLLHWLLPPITMMPAAFIVVFPRVLDRFQVWFDMSLPFPFDIPTRHFQEFQELAIVFFAMIYILNLKRRISAFEKAGAAR